MIDEQAPGRVLHIAFLAAAALLGGAGLIIDQYGDTFDLAQFPLHPGERTTVLERNAGGEAGVGGIFVRLVTDHDDFPGTLGMNLAGDRHGRQFAVDGLAAGHGDGVVKEDLVGNIDLGRDAGTDRQQTGMEIGTIANVLEYMPGLGIWEMADPVRALAAHLGVGICIAVHIRGHVVAADAALPPAALRHLGGAVMWTARAKIRNAGNRQILALRHPRRLGIKKSQARLDLLAAMKMRYPAGHGAGNFLGPEFTATRQHLVTVAVMAADDPWPLSIRQVVEDIADPALQKTALFLDHDDLFQAGGKAEHGVRVKGERHAHFQHDDTQIRRLRPIDAQLHQGLAHIDRRLAAGNDADAGFRALHHHLVQVVGAGQGHGGGQFEITQAWFLQDPAVAAPNMNTIIGEGEFRYDDLQTMGIAIDRGGGIHRIGDDFQPGPGA